MDIAAGENKVLDVSMVRKVANLQGWVTDAATGDPILQAVVELWQGGTRIKFDNTDATGWYHFDNIEPGFYTLVFMDIPDHATYTYESFEVILGMNELNMQMLPPTLEFGSSPDTGGSSVDGYVRRSVFRSPWADIHDGAGNGVNTTQQLSISIEETPYGTPAERWTSIARPILTFDTTPLLSNFTVSAASLTLCVYAVNLSGYQPNYPTLAIFESWPLADNNLQASDYQRLGSTPCSNLIPFTNINPTRGTLLTIPLNTYGLTKIMHEGITRLALREATYDAPNVEPEWNYPMNMTVLFYSAEAVPPNGMPPKLSVELSG